MKKNLIYAGMLLLGMTVATSCSNEESLEQVLNNGTTIQAVIEKATEARTSVNDNYEVLWTADDNFSVFEDGTKKATLTLSEGEGTTSGTFTIDNNITITEDMVALFPASETLGYTFADSYTSQETDAPMLGKFVNGKFEFELLTAMVRVVITDVPAGEAKLTITSDELNLTGEATLSNGVLETPQTGGKEVTVTIQNDTEGTLTFDVPVPVQGYTNGLNVKLTVGDTEVFNKTTNGFETAVGKIYVFGATVISDVESLMEAFINGGEYTLSSDVTLTEAVNIASDKTVTIDLNGNTLTTSTTTAGLDDITVAGKLNISNGSIESANTAFYVNGGELALGDCTITTTSRYATVYAVNGTVTAENVIAEVANTAFYAKGGTMTLTDCEVESTNGAYNVVSAMENAVLTINGGSYTSVENTASHDESYTIYVKKSTAEINTEVSGGNGGITVLDNSTVSLTGGSYSGVKACGLYVNGNSTVTYENCAFSGPEADVKVGPDGGTINGTTFTETVDFNEVSEPEALKSIIADGGYAILADNIDLNVTSGSLTIASDKEVIIDLNGKILTTSESTNTPATDDITVAGKLNISNGFINSANTAFYVNGGELALGDCTITTTSKYATVYAVNGTVTAENVIAEVANTAFYAKGGTMTLTDCEVESTNGAYNVVSAMENAVLTINGGSYTSVENTTSHDESYTIYVKKSTAEINTEVSGGNGGITVLDNSTVSLTGGSYSGVKACGLYVNGNSTVTYKDCTFSGPEADKKTADSESTLEEVE